MMERSDISTNAMANRAFLGLIGKFIKEFRLGQNKTQEELAGLAGINRSTLVQIENGKGGTLLSFIQLLRALDQLYILKNFEIKPQISPIQLAKLQESKRMRARKKK